MFGLWSYKSLLFLTNVCSYCYCHTMSTNLFTSGMAGTLFGSALTASGVYLPSAIMSQMELRDFHMLKVFLTASSASAYVPSHLGLLVARLTTVHRLILALYEQVKRQRLTRRAPANLGWFGSYDGNVIGGLMVGVGMTLTGACPGTVLVQVGTGVQSGRSVLLGGILGGILYTGVGKKLRRCAAGSSEPGKSLYTKVEMNATTAILLFEGMCISMILATRYLFPAKTETFLDPVSGGLFVGAAQFVTLVLTKAPVGVSTCYEDIGWWFWNSLGYTESGSTPARTLVPRTKAIAFAAGIFASSYTLSKTVPEITMSDSLQISSMRGILGGLIMAFGARMAGGCTSGHGISGMSMLAISSLVTVGSMFAGGIGLAMAM